MLAVRTEEGPEPRNADTFPISFPGGSGLAGAAELKWVEH